MKTHIMFFCSKCEDMVEGRFQPEDETGIVLIISCEKCHTMVGMCEYADA